MRTRALPPEANGKEPRRFAVSGSRCAHNLKSLYRPPAARPVSRFTPTRALPSPRLAPSREAGRLTGAGVQKSTTRRQAHRRPSLPTLHAQQDPPRCDALGRLKNASLGHGRGPRCTVTAINKALPNHPRLQTDPLSSPSPPRIITYTSDDAGDEGPRTEAGLPAESDQCYLNADWQSAHGLPFQPSRWQAGRLAGSAKTHARTRRGLREAGASSWVSADGQYRRSNGMGHPARPTGPHGHTGMATRDTHRRCRWWMDCNPLPEGSEVDAAPVRPPWLLGSLCWAGLSSCWVWV